MIRKKLFLAALLVGIGGAMAACGSEGTSDPGKQNGSGGTGGDDGTGGTGGDDGTGGTGGDDGTGGTGGDDGTGGTGGDDGTGGTGGDTGTLDCEAVCDVARDECEWLDAGSPSYEEERAVCVQLCELEAECLPAAILACDDAAFDACLLPPDEISPDETPECAAMCDHLYGDCEMTLGVSRGDCGRACLDGAFSEAQIECFTVNACELEVLQACFEIEEEEPPLEEDEACVAACDHLIDECGLDTWTQTSCMRACKAAYTPDEKECLATLECTEDPVTTCFGELSCVAMCDHVYNECGTAIGDGDQEDCEVLCRFGLFTDTEVTCFASAQCTELDACSELPEEEAPPAPGDE